MATAQTKTTKTASKEEAGEQSWQPTAVIKIYRSGEIEFEFAPDTTGSVIAQASKRLLKAFRAQRNKMFWESNPDLWAKELGEKTK